MTFAAVAIALGLPVVFFTASTLGLAAWPHLRDGTLPEEAYVQNYVMHPMPAVTHIIPGFLFILGALFQLSTRFRRHHLTLHRRMGRILVLLGLTSALSALYVGIDHPYNGWPERSATIVFGTWMLWCLLAAFAAIRRRDVAQHRRWMIRAFVIAFGIATVRVWTALFIGLSSARSGQPPSSDFPQEDTFGLAFWLGWGMHAAIAELWLRRGVGSSKPAQPARP